MKRCEVDQAVQEGEQRKELVITDLGEIHW